MQKFSARFLIFLLSLFLFATEDAFSFSGNNIILTPNPDFDALQVATLCMDALQNQQPDQSMELCFNFSSDRCRAAVGGTLEEFMHYAANPVFGKLVHCGDYKVASVGPIIPGSQVRGDMQTVLIEISKGLTVSDVIKDATTKKKKRRNIEERIRQSEAEARGEVYVENENEQEGEQANGSPSAAAGAARFLWTLQKERRPPRQNCWLVHEVLSVKYAFSQTE